MIEFQPKDPRHDIILRNSALKIIRQFLEHCVKGYRMLSGTFKIMKQYLEPSTNLNIYRNQNTRIEMVSKVVY